MQFLDLELEGHHGDGFQLAEARQLLDLYFQVLGVLDHDQAVVQQLYVLEFHEGDCLYLLSRRKLDGLEGCRCARLCLAVHQPGHLLQAVQYQLHLFMKDADQYGIISRPVHLGDGEPTFFLACGHGLGHTDEDLYRVREDLQQDLHQIFLVVVVGQDDLFFVGANLALG